MHCSLVGMTEGWVGRAQVSLRPRASTCAPSLVQEAGCTSIAAQHFLGGSGGDGGIGGVGEWPCVQVAHTGSIWAGLFQWQRWFAETACYAACRLGSVTQPHVSQTGDSSSGATVIWSVKHSDAAVCGIGCGLQGWGAPPVVCLDTKEGGSAARRCRSAIAGVTRVCVVAHRQCFVFMATALLCGVSWSIPQPAANTVPQPTWVLATGG
jgi:hypothetical protein